MIFSNCTIKYYTTLTFLRYKYADPAYNCKEYVISVIDEIIELYITNLI